MLKRVRKFFRTGLVLYKQQFGQTRGGTFKKATVVNLLGRVVSGFVSLISVRLSITYLTSEGFGILTTVTSITGWLALTNLGFGIGLQNLLIDAVAKGDVARERRLIATTQIVLGSVCLLILVAWAGVCQSSLISWNQLLNVSAPKFVDEVSQAVFWSGVVVLVLVYTSYVQAIYAANQKLHRLGLWQMVSQLGSLLGLVVASLSHASLSGVVLALYGVPAGIMLLNAVWLGIRHPERYLPRMADFSLPDLKQLLKFGGSFTLIGITGALQYGTDTLIISNVLGASYVTSYAVVMRLFNFFQSLMGSQLMPMWAVLANAKSSGDWPWIRKQFGRVRNLTMGINLVFFIGMMVFGQLIIHLWLGSSVQVSLTLIALVGFYALTRAWADLHSILCNALDQAPLSAVLGIPVGVITVLIMYFSAVYFGLNGMVLSEGLVMLLTAGLALPYIASRTLKRLASHV